MYRYIIAPLLFCCLTTLAVADDVQLQENHPDRYVVVKGDTLWAISAKFLKDPWQWPKVWKMNREQIKNPHRIYPGDVVVLDMSSGQPELRLLSNKTVTLEPGIRVEPLDKEAIPTIAPNIIGPFLAQPLVIEPKELDEAPIIVAGPDDRVAITANMKAYASKIEDGDGKNWHIYRPGKTLIDPESKEVLGVEAVFLGDATVTKYGEPAAIQIVRSKEEIFTKDKLVTAPDVIQSSFVPRAPEADIHGRIMSIYGGVAETGRNNVIAISRGSNDGLEEGHVLAINRLGRLVRNPDLVKVEKLRKEQADRIKELKKNNASKEEIKAVENEDPSMIRLPEERIGLAMVFKTFNRVSYALIMQTTQQVYVLDTVSTP